MTTDEQGGSNRQRLHLREISGEGGAQLGTVGQELRAARLRRGEDLTTVSQALKIRKDHLSALEEDRFEGLPGRTYAVGFVRSYAEHLGLDTGATLERFKEEIAGRSDGSYQITLVPDADERRLPHGWVVMAVVLVGIIAYAVYHLAISADALLRQPVAPVPARIAPPVATLARPAASKPLMTAHSQGTPAGATTKSAPEISSAPAPPMAPTGSRQVLASLPATKLSVGAHPATASSNPTPEKSSVTSASGALSSGQQVQAGPSAIKPSTVGATAATSPVSPTAPPSITPAPRPQAPAPAQGQEYGSQNADARIILHVQASTRVLVQGPDGKVFIDRMLQPGDSYRVPDEQGLTLTTPDGGAVAVEMDGQQVGFAGKHGQVTESLPLDPQAVMDRYNQASPGQGG